MSRVEEEWVAEGHRGVFTRETRSRLRAGGGKRLCSAVRSPPKRMPPTLLRSH